jgi:hypothetical protein
MTTLKPDYALNLAVVYDGAESQLRASRLCQQATQSLGLDAVSFVAWNITDLKRSDLLPRAVEAAVAADIILVSLSGERTLPLMLCVWIDKWLPRRGQRPGALVAMVADLSSLGKRYLEAVAQRAKLDFYLHDGKPWGDSTSLSCRPNLSNLTPTATAVLDQFMAQPQENRAATMTKWTAVHRGQG